MKEDRCIGQAEPTLGVYPDCDVVILFSNLLIKYETEGGWPQFFAECPQCEDPVHPG
jgi:peptide methionine sulfoxide reductase MsrB